MNPVSLVLKGSGAGTIFEILEKDTQTNENTIKDSECSSKSYKLPLPRDLDPADGGEIKAFTVSQVLHDPGCPNSFDIPSETTTEEVHPDRNSQCDFSNRYRYCKEVLKPCLKDDPPDCLSCKELLFTNEVIKVTTEFPENRSHTVCYKCPPPPCPPPPCPPKCPPPRCPPKCPLPLCSRTCPPPRCPPKCPPKRCSSKNHLKICCGEEGPTICKECSRQDCPSFACPKPYISPCSPPLPCPSVCKPACPSTACPPPPCPPRRLPSPSPPPKCCSPPPCPPKCPPPKCPSLPCPPMCPPRPSSPPKCCSPAPCPPKCPPPPCPPKCPPRPCAPKCPLKCSPPRCPPKCPPPPCPPKCPPPKCPSLPCPPKCPPPRCPRKCPPQPKCTCRVSPDSSIDKLKLAIKSMTGLAGESGCKCNKCPPPSSPPPSSPPPSSPPPSSPPPSSPPPRRPPSGCPDSRGVRKFLCSNQCPNTKNVSNTILQTVETECDTCSCDDMPPLIIANHHVLETLKSAMTNLMGKAFKSTQEAITVIKSENARQLASLKNSTCFSDSKKSDGKTKTKILSHTHSNTSVYNVNLDRPNVEEKVISIEPHDSEMYARSSSPFGLILDKVDSAVSMITDSLVYELPRPSKSFIDQNSDTATVSQTPSPTDLENVMRSSGSYTLFSSIQEMITSMFTGDNESTTSSERSSERSSAVTLVSETDGEDFLTRMID